jgi:hypothetical protein
MKNRTDEDQNPRRAIRCLLEDQPGCTHLLADLPHLIVRGFLSSSRPCETRPDYQMSSFGTHAA